MGINFKYIRKKSNINDFPNTPGKSGKSINGEQGLKGILKPSLHITDYDPSDEYTKNIILGRIDENYSVLKNSSEKILDGYALNDILITRENDVYKLTEGVGTHKFDLLFLGTMKNRPENKPAYEKLEEGISSISLNINVNNNYDFTRDLCNRNFDCRDSNIYNPFTYPNGKFSNGYEKNTGQRQINGVEIEPLIIASKEILDDYDFILDIYLPNEKSYEPDTIDSHVFNLNHIIKSISPLEFEEEPVHPAFSKNVLFDKKLSIVLQKDKGHKKYFLSDMSCDKLHLYGNEYKTNVTDTIDRTVKGGSKTFYCNDVKLYVPSPRSRTLALSTNIYQTNPTAVFHNNQKIFLGEKGLSSGYSDDFTYISYCVREDYGGNKDKRFVNFRGGESTYFSSIVPREYLTSDEAKKIGLSDSSINIENIGSDLKYCSFLQYINNVQCTNLSMYSDKDSLFSKEKGTYEWFYALNRNFELRKLIFKEILNFISSDRNKYELRCIHKSGTVYILNITPDGGKIIWKLTQ